MELIISLCTIAVFSFFYYIGAIKRNYILELMCSIGFVVMGSIMFGTGVQVFDLTLMNTTSTVTGNVTVDQNVYAMNGYSVPAASAGGWLLIFVGLALSIVTWLGTIAHKKDSEADE